MSLTSEINQAKAKIKAAQNGSSIQKHWMKKLKILLSMQGGPRKTQKALIESIRMVNPEAVELFKANRRTTKSWNLIAAFDWSQSPEGHDYWHGIFMGINK
jgi:hypothetical protein